MPGLYMPPDIMPDADAPLLVPILLWSIPLSRNFISQLKFYIGLQIPFQCFFFQLGLCNDTYIYIYSIRVTQASA